MTTHIEENEGEVPLDQVLANAQAALVAYRLGSNGRVVIERLLMAVDRGLTEEIGLTGGELDNLLD